ncbi:GNAT family N-acetyltransferase [Enterococcus saccharolyticus]|uniref:N-acetyltransferase domain-containing protein n=1 Tax=Enterococcus saccharolyticus subsp. saccharolyticus ATCC 43076 TaxID=1139996 RepID=S0J7J7_9ENTE|nr:GNAT family N-acetyltransferase [Enterococcus saccharolyticus]EOT28859.1 hypothetical protein OMQ_01381 [Enterococcus saccharolyticus subsp. saccharolyticus ATCC 43076]EOT81225.1 hypothetical protein I572_01760 [Enterococcus saccharolyticus subsp. saccharolyticus ATCC 43076]
MRFRLATIEDLPSLMSIINDAIQVLHEQGSPQWQNGYGPNEEKLRKDIEAKTMYVLEESTILALGALIPGIDPVYTAIEGTWEGGSSYMSIHRIAVAKQASGKGLAKTLLQHLVMESQKQGISDVRIDTHALNKGMQKAILDTGFHYRGVVYFPIPDGKRYAYQKMG